jgi:hypothetical protein
MALKAGSSLGQASAQAQAHDPAFDPAFDPGAVLSLLIQHCAIVAFPPLGKQT